MQQCRPLTRVLLGGLGTGALLGLWVLVANRGGFDGAVPEPSEVWDVLRDPLRRPMWERAVGATLRESAWGLLFGATAAFALAAVPVTMPPLRRTSQWIAATVQALPVIVLGPVLVTVLPDGQRQVPVVIAALAAFFAMFIPVMAGFDSSSAMLADLFHALGSGRVRRLRSLHVPAALPMAADGLRLAAPAAVFGAVFGEWFGAERGLGVLVVTSMRNVQVPMLWATASLITVVCAIAYGAGTGVQRMASAWVR